MSDGALKTSYDLVIAFWQRGFCDVCGSVGLMLQIDNSAGEYPTKSICWACLESSFEDASRKHVGG